LGCDEVDDLLASLYYTKSPDSPKFNKLFATLYNLMFSKLTNLVPGEVHCTDKFLTSAEIISYLKWLIYFRCFQGAYRSES